MKALPMLDHVALWYARIFASFVTSLLGIRFLSSLVHKADNYASQDIYVILGFTIWFIGSFYLNHVLIRMFLSISSSVVLGVIAWHVGNRLIELLLLANTYPLLLLVFWLIVMTVELLGLAAMTWAAVRAPQNSKTASVNLFPKSC